MYIDTLARTSTQRQRKTERMRQKASEPDLALALDAFVLADTFATTIHTP